MNELSPPEIRTLYGLFGEGQNPVTQEAIPWCTTHDISKDIPNPNSAADRPEDCLLSEYREGECVISRGGPDHDWWRNI